MSNFVYFRLPDENVYYKLICNVVRLGDLSELKGVEGFVMAPFKATHDCPLVLSSRRWCSSRRCRPSRLHT